GGGGDRWGVGRGGRPGNPAPGPIPRPGLEGAGVARLIREITGVVPREGVVAAVRRGTEGNPLFVGEVARLLAAEDRLERAGDPAGRGPGTPGRNPAAVGGPGARPAGRRGPGRGP